MAQIYQLNGMSVYDLNGQTINAKTGQPISDAPAATSTATTSAPPSLIPQTSAPSSSGKPPIPSSLYDSVRGAISNGTMSPQQAKDYLQSYISGGTYGGTVNTTTLYAPMSFQKDGLTYGLNQDGSISSLSGSNNTSSTSVSTGQTNKITVGASTGNPTLDGALQQYAGIAKQLIAGGYTIPANLQVTPDLVAKFLSIAHTQIDPYYRQQIASEAANINASLKNLQTQFENTQAGIAQKFGTDLANEQNAAGANGTAFSGQRNLNEANMVASTNRELASNASETALQAGNALRAGAANVGSANAGAFNLPTIAGAGTVSNQGGARGSYSATGNALDFGYNPSTYAVGTIPSNRESAAQALQQTYLGNYGTLAGAQSNSGRSVDDLIKGVTTGGGLT